MVCESLTGRIVLHWRNTPMPSGRLSEEWRLPTGEGARKAVGKGGHRLLAAAYDPSAPTWLHELPAVQTLRFDSPYEPDARYGNKHSPI